MTFKIFFILCAFACSAFAADSEVMTHTNWNRYHCGSPRLPSGETYIGVGYQLMCAIAVTNSSPEVSDCRLFEEAISPEAVEHPLPLMKTRSENPEFVEFLSPDGRLRVQVLRANLNAEVEFATGARMECLIRVP